MPSAGKAFQRSSAPGRQFAHTRPQSIRKITAITLKQEQLSISSSGTQVASGSGLCSETWAWMRAIYFHLVFWRIWHFSKNNAEKLKQNKAHGFGICCLFSVAVRPHVLCEQNNPCSGCGSTRFRIPCVCVYQRFNGMQRKRNWFSLIWALEPNIAFGGQSLEIQWEVCILYSHLVPICNKYIYIYAYVMCVYIYIYTCVCVSTYMYIYT